MTLYGAYDGCQNCIYNAVKQSKINKGETIVVFSDGGEDFTELFKEYPNCLVYKITKNNRILKIPHKNYNPREWY